MVNIKKEFLNNYNILNLNKNATTFNDIAETKDGDSYIFIPLTTSTNNDLIYNILRKSKENNTKLLNDWENKPWSDEEIYSTANSYLTKQFGSSKLNIKNEISITGEENAKSRFSQLLKMYLPILVAHLTFHDNYVEGYKTFLEALSWDDNTIFLPLPVDENGLIIWNDIFDSNVEEEEEEEQDPITYDTNSIGELFDRFYDKVERKISEEINDLKEYMKHIYKMIPKSNISLNTDGSEFVIDETANEINEKVRDINAKADAIINEESDDVDMLKKEIETLTNDNNKFIDKIKTLENQLNIVNEENDRLVKRSTEFDSEIVELKNRIAELEDQLENSVSSENANLDEEATAIIGVKDNEIAELKQELETRVENEKLLRERNSELEEADNTLRKELNKSNEENVNLNRELSSLQNEVSSYIDANRRLERDNEKLIIDNKGLEKTVADLEKELANIKKEKGIDELEKIKEDNRILRKALEDYKQKMSNNEYMKEKEEENIEVKETVVDEEQLAREKANRDRIGRMIYGDAYDGTQTF